jgi:cytochrome c oxidase assembly protein subunit 15
MYSRSVHILAILTTLATFPLIFMGGLVTSHGAGMSVPDWPNSYGYNMFMFPPRLWIGGILYEHTHRLMGTVVGMLAIALTITAWRSGVARRIKWLCTGVLLAVIFQGVLGGLRVVLVKLDLAVVHACVAQAFFCLSALAALTTSRWWNEAGDDAPHRARALIVACVFATALIYAQLIVGALMRHYGAGLAIPDFPLAYGKLIPATDSASLAHINQQRAWHLNLQPVTATQDWLHMGHRIGALLVTLTTLLASLIALIKHRRDKIVVIPALLLIALLAGQIMLGALTVLLRKPADIASLHVAVGALTLVTMFMMTVASIRLSAKPQAAAQELDRLDPQVIRARLAAA